MDVGLKNNVYVMIEESIKILTKIKIIHYWARSFFSRVAPASGILQDGGGGVSPSPPTHLAIKEGQ